MTGRCVGDYRVTRRRSSDILRSIGEALGFAAQPVEQPNLDLGLRRGRRRKAMNFAVGNSSGGGEEEVLPTRCQSKQVLPARLAGAIQMRFFRSCLSLRRGGLLDGCVSDPGGPSGAGVGGR